MMMNRSVAAWGALTLSRPGTARREQHDGAAQPPTTWARLNQSSTRETMPMNRRVSRLLLERVRWQQPAY